MKKIIYLILFFAVTLSVILVLRSFFPIYAGRLIFLAVFLFADLVLWISIRKWLSRRSRRIRFLLSGLFWFPFTLLLLLVFFGFAYPFTEWPIPVRTYLMSCLLIIVAAKVFPLLFLILASLIEFVLSLISGSPYRRIQWIRLSGWLTGGLFGLLLLAGMVFWVYDFKVDTLTFNSSVVPKEFNNFRIVQFSDVHLGNWACKSRLEEAVKIIDNLKPDLIVFTGDMFTFSTNEGLGFEGILKRLHAPYGIFAILGNHDYGDYVKWGNSQAKELNFNEMKKFYKELGWNLMLNKSGKIGKGADSIVLLGVENWGAAKRFQKYGDIEKAMQGVNKAGFSILLSHDPSYWDSITSHTHPEIALTLSGHTHGGQIGIETGRVKWSILSASNPFWGGLYTRQTGSYLSTLYVNRGLGTVGYAGRVGIKPEITLIILHHEN